MSSDSAPPQLGFVHAVADRLHDACRAAYGAESTADCYGSGAHFLDALNALNAACELPVEQRMEAMGMEPMWFHVGHGLHDTAHHQAHRPMDVCVPLYMRDVR